MLGNTQSILTLLADVSHTQTSMSIFTLNDVIVEFLSPLVPCHCRITHAKFLMLYRANAV